LKAKGLVGLLLLCAFAAAAKDVKVRKAWERSFPNTSLGIFPDNLGHIAAVGTDTNSFVLLLNKQGRRIAKASIPFSGVAGAVADSSGRIFVSGGEWRSSLVYCAAFAPSLSRFLWVEQKNLSNAFAPPSTFAGIGPLVPDENGAAFIFGTWHRGFFLTEFRGGNAGLKSIWDPWSGVTRYAQAGVRSPSGEIYFVASSVAGGHYCFLTIQKFTPAAQELITFGANPPPDAHNGYSLARAAASDTDGNLIVVGWHSDDAQSFYRRGRCFTIKMDAQLNVLWSVLHGPLDNGPGIGLNIATAVAVDNNDNIIMTGNVGTVKYSPGGQVLWEVPITGATFNLDRFGNVLLSQASRAKMESPNQKSRSSMLMARAAGKSASTTEAPPAAGLLVLCWITTETFTSLRMALTAVLS
jgi:hypothetical protein